jgi:hypothetical protein
VPVSRLVSNDFEVVGVDFAMEQLRLAHQLIPRAEFVCQDMTRLGFAEECFDAIVSYYALINVPREEHRQVLLDFRKVLKASGLALLCMGAGDLPGAEGDFMGATMYWSHHGAQDNIKMLEECGFDIILSKIIVMCLTLLRPIYSCWRARDQSQTRIQGERPLSVRDGGLQASPLLKPFRYIEKTIGVVSLSKD